MNNKLNSMLSLAQKAGAIKSGEEICEKIIASGEAYLALIASDASDNTKKKFTNKCHFYDVPLYDYFSKGDIERRTGLVNRAILVVTNQNLAIKLIELLNIAMSGGV